MMQMKKNMYYKNIELDNLMYYASHLMMQMKKHVL